MAGIQDLIPTVTSQEDFQTKWNTANTQTDPTAYRQGLLTSLDALSQNQNVQNLYNLNQGNANTFLKDASAGLDSNTHTYTPDAWKTMTAFEKVLSGGDDRPTLAGNWRQDVANALMQEFQGTGSNPLLGQYNLAPAPTGTQGGILPWQNGVMTPGMGGTPAYTPPKPLNAANTSAALANTGTAAGTTGTAAGTTGTSTSPAKIDSNSLKTTYGITNPSLITYITSTPGLSDSDIKNLSLAFNSKTPQEVNDMQTSGSQPLYAQAKSELEYQASLLQKKKDLADPNSWIYKKGNVPVYTTASQSTNAVGDVFTTKNSGIVDQYKDQNGYVHITSGGNQYLINPNSNRILGITPITHDGGLMPFGQGPNPYGGALAKGGTVQMPQEYSRGNWKLI